MSRLGVRHTSGDATLIDNGFFSPEPRYEVKFDGFYLSNSVKRVFVFNGIPTVDMTLSFEFPNTPSTEPALQALHESGAELRVRIENERGDLIATAQSPIKGWELHQSSTSMAFWHPALRDLQLPTSENCRLTVAVTHGPTNGAFLLVQPSFTGGGIVFP